jgi:hypothetical protein
MPREEVGDDSGPSSSATTSGYSSPVFLRYATLHLFSAPPLSPGRMWERIAVPPPQPPHWLQLPSLSQVCLPPPVLSSTHEPREEVGDDSGPSSSATPSGYSSPVFLRCVILLLFSAPHLSPERRWGMTAVPPPPPPCLATAPQSSSGMPPCTYSQRHPRAQRGGGGG